MEINRVPDVKEFEEEFLKHRSHLISYLYRMLANREESEDICSQSYLKARESLATFRRESSLKTWFFAVATHLALDLLRDRKRWKTNAQDKCRSEASASVEIQEEFQRIHATSPTGQYDIKEHIDFCFTCIGKTLPLENQVVLLLKDVYNFETKEIAKIMEKTEPFVKHALHIARRSLEEIFSGRCSIINKSGTCYQCSELNGYFNPKRDSALEIAALDLQRRSKTVSGIRLLHLRTRLIGSLNPIHGQGSDFHEYLYRLIHRQEE